MRLFMSSDVSLCSPSGLVLDRDEPTEVAGENSFLEDVWSGLASDGKTLPCKYLYDEVGSRLFDDICEVPEYYVTRTEIAILQENLDEIVDRLGTAATLIEPGAGSGLKTRLLLEHAKPSAYVPVDISGAYLAGVAATLQADFPELCIEPLAADFTKPLPLVAPELDGSPRVLYFPGSTIGNFTPEEAIRLLAQWRHVAGEEGKLLIGVDLEKDARVLEAAYDDAAGVTAAFNRNLLTRINRELDGTFDLEAFTHRATYNRRRARVEMHLDASSRQTVHVGGRAFEFAAGESIHTENSHKYSLARFERIASEAGWRVDRVWSDADELFSEQLLVAS